MNKFQPKHFKTIAINRSAFVLLTFTEIKTKSDLINDDCSDCMLCFQSFLYLVSGMRITGNFIYSTTGAARHGQGGHLPPPPGNVQMGICNPSPKFLTVFVVGLSRIS